MYNIDSVRGVFMERIYAFTDESGAFGWDLNNPNVSTHFVISSIIVKENELSSLKASVEALRQKHFQTGEIKSSYIGKNDSRRQRVWADFLQLPFSIFSVVVDKKQIMHMPGLRFKPSFYKFMNNIVHKELRRAFSRLTIVADEIGGSEYMKSFSNYVSERQDIPTLLGESEFYFENSESDVLIQLADLASGTLARIYDDHLKDETSYKFKKILDKKIIRVEFYPKTYASYTIDGSALAENYHKEIAEVCLKQVIEFINKYDKDEDSERIAQIIILNYLLFRFINNDLRKYIPTRELMKQLSNTDLAEISVQSFRTRIIGNLRDNGVIIASSSKGYKIPSQLSELYDFINHGTSIIIPMLERLKKCRDLIKLNSLNHIDLFDNTEYSTLKKYFDE